MHEEEQLEKQAMLFNSHEFIFLFLPITLVLFFAFGAVSNQLAALWLFAASLLFYAWWNPIYVGLLLASVGVNFLLGTRISRGVHGVSGAKILLIIGIAVNLALLAYFKYANFFVDNLNAVAGIHLELQKIVLPLGISFFTFTQIAFLVDAYRGEVKEYNIIHYGLFVTYFPHLIAGPILHHKEMMPQFANRSVYRLNMDDIAIGLSVFSIGLFKKVILADGVVSFVGPVFNAPATGIPVTFVDAWFGALAYTLQLYFDFSGYSDMAIGLSRLFGIRLPLNFASPYKAESIIDFWRRWHMTLSRFLKDYLYVPLGGNRKGLLRRYVNLFVTMLLGGLWHGAAWTFVVWGALHGAYLVVNHAWRWIKERLGWVRGRVSWHARWASRCLTFGVVVVAWVFFRSENLNSAIEIVKAMFGMGSIVLPEQFHSRLGPVGGIFAEWGVAFGAIPNFAGAVQVKWVLGLLALVWLMPNTQQIMNGFEMPRMLAHGARPQFEFWQWEPKFFWAALAAIAFVASILNLTHTSEFLYFQF